RARAFRPPRSRVRGARALRGRRGEPRAAHRRGRAPARRLRSRARPRRTAAEAAAPGALAAPRLLMALRRPRTQNPGPGEPDLTIVEVAESQARRTTLVVLGILIIITAAAATYLGVKSSLKQ